LIDRGLSSFSQISDKKGVSVAPLLQVNAGFFRAQMPDLILREGMTLAARVAERNGKHGVITLAGAALLAELPDGVNTGDKLRLLVADTRQEKVVMKLVQDQPAAAPQQAQAYIANPDGTQSLLTVDEDGSSEDDSEGGRDREHAAVGLTYETPRLGKLGLKLEIGPGVVRVRVEARAGGVYEAADDASDALRRRLAERTGRAAEVVVVPRVDHVDAYA
jgi:hypothetical protein